MSQDTHAAPGGAPIPPSVRRRPGVAWLLAVPLLAVVYPPLYNRADPHLAGMPFFYWYQLAMIPVSVVCTTLVYRATRAGRRPWPADPAANEAPPTAFEADPGAGR